jgi:hypothetical protein
MRYFTRDWVEGKLSDERAEQVKKEYWDHINQRYPDPSKTCQELLKNLI